MAKTDGYSSYARCGQHVTWLGGRELVCTKRKGHSDYHEYRGPIQIKGEPFTVPFEVPSEIQLSPSASRQLRRLAGTPVGDYAGRMRAKAEAARRKRG